MKKTSLIFGIIIFTILTAIILIQYTTLVKAKRAIDSLKNENEAFKKQNADAMLAINDQQLFISQLQRQSGSHSDDIAKIRKENSELITQNKELAKKLEGKTEQISNVTDESTASKKEDDNAKESPSEAKGDSKPENKMKEYLETMLSTPEMKERMKEGLRASTDMMMKDLFDSLNLSDEDLSKFKEMIVDKGMVRMEMGLAMMGEANEENKKKMEQELKDKVAKIDDDMRMLIGESGYEDYVKYGESLADRMTLNEYKKRLGLESIAPLDERQEKELLAAFAEEKKNYSFSNEFASESNFDFNRFTQQNLELFLKERQEFADRMIERSKTILIQQQWEQYKASMENQLKLEKMQMEMAAKIFGNNSSERTKTTETDGTKTEEKQGDGEGNIKVKSSND